MNVVMVAFVIDFSDKEISLCLPGSICRRTTRFGLVVYQYISKGIEGKLIINVFSNKFLTCGLSCIVFLQVKPFLQLTCFMGINLRSYLWLFLKV